MILMIPIVIPALLLPVEKTLPVAAMTIPLKTLTIAVILRAMMATAMIGMKRMMSGSSNPPVWSENNR
jgi:hypothetical protein